MEIQLVRCECGAEPRFFCEALMHSIMCDNCKAYVSVVQETGKTVNIRQAWNNGLRGWLVGDREKPHITLGRGEQGEFLIYIDGNLRGKYATAEIMQLHFADCLAECDRLRKNQRPETAREMCERLGLEVIEHDPVEGLLGG